MSHPIITDNSIKLEVRLRLQIVFPTTCPSHTQSVADCYFIFREISGESY